VNISVKILEGTMPRDKKLYLPNALDPIADAEVHDDPTDHIAPKYRPHYVSNFIDA
jgi:hypothetical protein